MVRVAAFLPATWQPTQEERKKTWRKLFSRSSRSMGSSVSSNDSVGDVSSIATPALTISSASGSTRATTPEMPDPELQDTLPPLIPAKSSLRAKRMTMMATDYRTTSMYPAPLNIPQRPTTSSSCSPTTPESDWNKFRSGFSSTHPACSPLARDRPVSIFSQRDYEPGDETPEYITLTDEGALILTLTSKYPTGAAAELYVPIDCSVPRRPAIGRRISERIRTSISSEQNGFGRPRPMSMYSFT